MAVLTPGSPVGGRLDAGAVVYGSGEENHCVTFENGTEWQRT